MQVQPDEMSEEVPNHHDQERPLKHAPYQHIVNSDVRSHMLRYRRLLSEQAWVEEKIDGSNFSMVTDGVQVRVAKRNFFLEPDENFFNYQKLSHPQNLAGTAETGAQTTDLCRAQSAAMKLHADLQLPKGHAVLHLYGELIPTQKRIPYLSRLSSEKEDTVAFFFAYELHVHDSLTEKKRVVPREVWEPLARSRGFIVNPVLFSGTLKECLALDVEDWGSVVPQLIGLSHRVPVEGIVIRSCVEPSFIVKKKTRAFCESEYGNDRRRFFRGKGRMDPLEESVIDLLSAGLTESRLGNVVSEIGDQMVRDAPRLANAVVLDAIKEARDDDDSPVRKITSSKLSKIQKALAADYAPDVAKFMGWPASS
jgi:Rnl2 family RNA ligase